MFGVVFGGFRVCSGFRARVWSYVGFWGVEEVCSHILERSRGVGCGMRRKGGKKSTLPQGAKPVLFKREATKSPKIMSGNMWAGSPPKCA